RFPGGEERLTGCGKIARRPDGTSINGRRNKPYLLEKNDKKKTVTQHANTIQDVPGQGPDGNRNPSARRPIGCQEVSWVSYPPAAIWFATTKKHIISA
ncbi:MAG: hypothetical protein P8Z73_07205, partial [Desulfobacteraceae bacterium]